MYTVNDDRAAVRTKALRIERLRELEDAMRIKEFGLERIKELEEANSRLEEALAMSKKRESNIGYLIGGMIGIIMTGVGVVIAVAMLSIV